MAVPLRSQYDMTLTYGGKSYGYQLYEDQYGQKHWNEGLADLIAPQSRISEFSYEHIPPQIDVPAAFENWSIGAGYTEFRAQFEARDGLEGPFFYANGRVLYYDPKEGKYWDPTTDFYVDDSEINGLHALTIAKLVG